MFINRDEWSITYEKKIVKSACMDAPSSVLIYDRYYLRLKISNVLQGLSTNKSKNG